MYGLTRARRGESNLFKMFDDFEKGWLASVSQPMMGIRTDIKDNGDSYQLEAELPGFDKKDINIEVEDNVLTISAEHTEEKTGKGEGENRYVTRERRYGSFTRTFDISGIDDEKIAGEYKDGILTLTLPKAPDAKPEKKKIALK